MKLSTLMHQLYDEINKFGVITNKLAEKAGVYTLRITKQEMAKKFLDIVNPRYKTAPRQANL